MAQNPIPTVLPDMLESPCRVCSLVRIENGLHGHVSTSRAAGPAIIDMNGMNISVLHAAAAID